MRDIRTSKPDFFYRKSNKYEEKKLIFAEKFLQSY